MRLLLTIICLSVFQVPAMAADKMLTFSMIDMDVEMQKGTAHLIAVSLDDKGGFRTEDRSLIPAENGEYVGVVHDVLDDGTITAVMHVRRLGQAFTGNYAIVSGSGTYVGAHGQGSLTTLTGYDAAASSTGIYRLRLQVTLPDHRVASDE